MIFRTSQGGICDRSLEGSGKNSYLDGGFKDFLFSPLLGEDSHFDLYVSKGLRPPTRIVTLSLDGFLAASHACHPVLPTNWIPPHQFEDPGAGSS